MVVITEEEYRTLPEACRGLSGDSERPELRGRRTMLTDVNGLPTRLVEGESLAIVQGRPFTGEQPPTPLPGHAVIITENDDPLAPAGTFGIIVGIIGNYGDHRLICLNPAPVPFKDEKFCHAVGTPTYRIEVRDLAFTSLAVPRTFRRSLPGRPWCGDVGERYIEEVPLFELKTSFAKRSASTT